MKQSLINKIVLCKNCNHAFIINEQGDENTCDNCLSELEIRHQLIDEIKKNDSSQN
jgi:uncharacterized CHY-type Zn-finger protein